jgi:hypothetical protein
MSRARTFPAAALSLGVATAAQAQSTDTSAPQVSVPMALSANMPPPVMDTGGSFVWLCPRTSQYPRIDGEGSAIVARFMPHPSIPQLHCGCRSMTSHLGGGRPSVRTILAQQHHRPSECTLQRLRTGGDAQKLDIRLKADACRRTNPLRGIGTVDERLEARLLCVN